MEHAFDRVAHWRSERAAAGRMLLALDFDGTLAPIVPDPADAWLLPAVVAPLQRLSGRADTTIAIVTGRALVDARRRVPIDEIYFAGNHGLEIEGPGVESVHPDALATVDRIAACGAELRAEFARDDGVIIEEKRLSLSVHYRMVEDAERERSIQERVARICNPIPGVRLTDGKKVVELRPDVDWHKGRALQYLMEQLLDANDNVPVLFIGDDRTDEDAFRVLADARDAVVVGDPPPRWASARTHVRSPEEVAELLERLA